MIILILPETNFKKNYYCRDIVLMKFILFYTTPGKMVIVRNVLHT